jgi:hypothetical protein
MSVRGRVCRFVVSIAAVAGIVATPSTADAAYELDWYVPVAGYVRTDLLVSGYDVEPTTGHVFAVARNGGDTTLVVIDPATMDVVDSVLVERGRSYELNGIDVSSDGRLVAVTAGRSLHVMRASDLGGRVSTELPSGTWRVRMAGGGTDRSVVWSDTRAYLVEGAALTRLPARTAGFTAQFTFGDHPDRLYNSANGATREFDLSAGTTELRSVAAGSDAYPGFLTLHTTRCGSTASASTSRRSPPSSGAVTAGSCRAPIGWFSRTVV